jgi:hypothetical protein
VKIRARTFWRSLGFLQRLSKILDQGARQGKTFGNGSPWGSDSDPTVLREFESERGPSRLNFTISSRAHELVVLDRYVNGSCKPMKQRSRCPSWEVVASSCLESKVYQRNSRNRASVCEGTEPIYETKHSNYWQRNNRFERATGVSVRRNGLGTGYGQAGVIA